MQLQKILFDTIPAEGRSVEFCHETQAFNRALADIGYNDGQAVAALEGEAQLRRSGKDVFVMGQLTTRMRYGCVRCLETFERPLRAEFNLDLSPSVETESVAGGEVELSAAELEMEPVKSQSFELSTMVVEQAILAMSTYPVCRDECQGLCSQCGTAKKAGCDCDFTPTDPRLAILAKLKIDK